MFNGKRSEYSKFVASYVKKGSEIDPEEIYGKNSLLGSERFLRMVFKKMKTAGKTADAREQPDARDAGLVNADDILEILSVKMRITEDELWGRQRGNVYRKLLIYGLRRHTANSLREIGRIVKMDYSAVSALARRFEEEMKTDKTSRRLAERLAREVIKRRVKERWDFPANI